MQGSVNRIQNANGAVRLAELLKVSLDRIDFELPNLAETDPPASQIRLQIALDYSVLHPDSCCDSQREQVSLRLLGKLVPCPGGYKDFPPTRRYCKEGKGSHTTP